MGKRPPDLSSREKKSWNSGAVGALTGVRVLDLSRFIAGPLCAQNLADLGADVIKVERIGGEDTRQNAPRYSGKSIYTALFNRNKRAVTLNMRHARGREVLRDLAAWADIIVENFRPGTLEKMGLSPSVLAEINEKLILVSISGFGQEGRNRDRALFDCIAQAKSGLMTLNAQPDGVPILTKIFPADSLAAHHATIGALGALYHRERTGEGQVVHVSVFDALFSAIGTSVPGYLLTGEEPAQNGNRDDYNAPANLFQTTDGYVYLHAGTPTFWARFCSDVLGRPELASDPRYNSISARMKNQDEVERLVQDWTASRSGEDVEAVLKSAGIPCSIVADIPTVATDSQVWDRGMLMRVEDSEGDELVLIGNPVKLSRSPLGARYPPPQVGEHTEEVFSEILKMNKAELQLLRKEGVI